MKRRIFLSTTGTVGIAGAASGASLVSSIFTSISANVSLAEFSADTKKVLDHFVSELALNIHELGLNKADIASIARPVRIIKKEFNNDSHRIVYVNKAGSYIDLSIKNGLEQIRISNTL